MPKNRNKRSTVKDYSILSAENQVRHIRVRSYLEVLQQIGLTVDEEGQVLAKRRALQTCLELQDLKDNIIKTARSLLSRQEVEQVVGNTWQPIDPSVQFFGLEWEPAFKMWSRIGQDMMNFWRTVENHKAVDLDLLASTVGAIERLEHDVVNHAVAVGEKKLTMELLQGWELGQCVDEETSNDKKEGNGRKWGMRLSGSNVRKDKDNSTESNEVEGGKKKSSRRGKKRKNSIIDDITSIFHSTFNIQ